MTKELPPEPSQEIAAPSISEPRSMLGLNIGDINTRAYLFDSVENQYRLLGQSVSQTTSWAPYHDVLIGVRTAIRKLEGSVSRIIMDDHGRLVQPVNNAGEGIDQLSAVMAVDALRKILVFGFDGSKSLRSAERLARSASANEIKVIGYADKEEIKDQVELALNFKPDLIITAGGTEGGASEPVLRMLDTLLLVVRLMPERERPPILYAGNSSLHDELQRKFENLTKVYLAPNIRPETSREDLDGAVEQLSPITKIRLINRIAGLENLDERTGGNLLQAGSALRRIVQFLSKARSADKGVFGLNIDEFSTSLVIGFQGRSSLAVYPELGLSGGLEEFRENPGFQNISRWLTMEIPDEVVKSYILNKQLHPSSIPVTLEELVIEGALARQILRSALRKSDNFLPSKIPSTGANFLPWVEPILAAGDVLTRASSLADTLLILLDGLQPTGATTFVLDPYHIAPTLGAAAAYNPDLVVQVLDSNAFTHLGTVISPVGKARDGSPILRAVMKREHKQDIKIEVTQGSIKMLPLPVGSTATLQLHPLHKFDIGMGGPGIGGSLLVRGGKMGVVIDGRGRPLKLPVDLDKRINLFNKWREALEG